MDMVIESFTSPSDVGAADKTRVQTQYYRIGSVHQRVRMGRNANNCMHQLIQQATMRHNQIATSRSCAGVHANLAARRTGSNPLLPRRRLRHKE